ncbi:ABC transporter permease [Natranaerobius thermophilus]|uniref:ABC3 transporter permease protein domain-containing protein n=2 Tax=Natranaerobius TaxID=375928 RepID=B2A0S0_NATTJ|nr:ABC transporter permease [Natranaerobius thermophilus]ACB85950.1 protein of unknown function DUF214 [Natranaerobius thermophilus JW/NM-WN-LF]
MTFRDMNNLVYRNLKNNKSRTVMTIIAVAIACGYLILLASFGFGIQKTVIQGLLAQSELNQIAVYGVTGDNTELNREHIQEIEAMEDVKVVTRSARLGQLPKFEINSHRTDLSVGIVDFASEIKAGRELYRGRIPENDQEVVLDRKFAQLSDLETEAQELLGREIDMIIRRGVGDAQVEENFNLEVVGIFDSSEMAGMEFGPPNNPFSTNYSIYLPKGILDEIQDFTGTPMGQVVSPELIDTIMQFLGGSMEVLLELTGQEVGDEFDQMMEMAPGSGGLYEGVNVFAHEVERVEHVSDQLEEEGFRAFAVVDIIDNVAFYFQFLHIAMIFVGLIGIVIASLGIYNTMSMAVSERSHEIGIMKAIGTHPGTVRKIFLLESIYIGVIGAFLGIAIALIASTGINALLPYLLENTFETELPDIVQLSYVAPVLVITGFSLCFFVAVVSGMKPAVKATRINVLEALKREL